MVSGDLEKGDDDVDSVETASTSLVQRFIMEPRLLRMAASEKDEAAVELDDEVEEVGQGRIGELGTIISVIKIATELGEAVLPVVIREVESSPIGNLVIGVIGGIQDTPSGASGDVIYPGMPIPIKVFRRAIQGFLKSHAGLH